MSKLPGSLSARREQAPTSSCSLCPASSAKLHIPQPERQERTREEGGAELEREKKTYSREKEKETDIEKKKQRESERILVFSSTVIIIPQMTYKGLKTKALQNKWVV